MGILQQLPNHRLPELKTTIVFCVQLSDSGNQLPELGVQLFDLGIQLFDLGIQFSDVLSYKYQIYRNNYFSLIREVKNSHISFMTSFYDAHSRFG